eukprot:CFRG8224T1
MADLSRKKGPAALSKVGKSSRVAEIICLQDEYVDLLSLSGLSITPNSTVGNMRKSYFKLSLKIHPDKHNGSTEAKATFQALVIAFDALSNPEVAGEEKLGGGSSSRKRKKIERVARSYSGCYVTRIDCPCRHMTWGSAVLGNEKGAYNFFMQVIKQYSCGRCAMSFGCMTANHYCPLCKKNFDYDQVITIVR